MSKPLTDSELALASARHMARAMDLISGALRTPPAPQPAKRDPDLQWFETDDLGDKEWSLALGYSVDWDGGDCDVYIHRAELNTGQRVLELARGEIDVGKWEAIIYDEVIAARDAAAREHGDYDYSGDRGDWLYEQRKDREANK